MSSLTEILDLVAKRSAELPPGEWLQGDNLFKHEDDVLGRKEDREDTTQTHKETREDSLREEQTSIAAADEFTQICSGILVDTIDTDGAFNMIRDC